MKYDRFLNLDLSSVSSPGLLVDADEVTRNTQRMLDLVGGDPARLRPHVKTHKMSSIIGLQREMGIEQFKVATLAEAEMTAASGARDVLVAYQMVGPNVPRLESLMQRFPGTRFSAVIDHADALPALSNTFSNSDFTLELMIDVDCGMHRTGIPFGSELDQLRELLDQTEGVRFAGLQLYDGHLHQSSLETRELEAKSVIESAKRYQESHDVPLIVGGGSPTFPIWAKETSWQCSPGTPVFWDAGYGTSFADLPFEPALAIVTRVISKPTAGCVCLDLGHKAIAAESPLETRMQLPQLPDAKLLGQSEEHLVVQTSVADSLSLGQALIAIPRHVCPTVALHAFVTLIRDGGVTDERWSVDARHR